MLEHTNELEPTIGEANAINHILNTSPKEEAERLLNEFKVLGLSHITSTACAVKVCENVLNTYPHNYFRHEHWKAVKTLLLYNPIGLTEKIF
jgi:hypothetical protein